MDKTVTIEFDRIGVDVKPKKYIGNLEKSLIFDRFEKVLPGQLVEIKLPDNAKMSLSFVGERPEKFEVVEGILAVVMTTCAILFIHDNKLDVFSAL